MRLHFLLSSFCGKCFFFCVQHATFFYMAMLRNLNFTWSPATCQVLTLCLLFRFKVWSNLSMCWRWSFSKGNCLPCGPNYQWWVCVFLLWYFRVKWLRTEKKLKGLQSWWFWFGVVGLGFDFSNFRMGRVDERKLEKPSFTKLENGP